MALVAHHLAIDGVSWRILIDDLGTLYASDARETAAARECPGSYTAGVRAVAVAAEGAAAAALAAAATLASSPRADAVEPSLFGDLAEVEASLDAATTTALLEETGAAFRTRPFELMLAALLPAIAEWLGESKPVIDLEGHGRDLVGCDLSRTTGWFTNIMPLCLGPSPSTEASPATASPDALICGVKEQVRAAERDGADFARTRYLHPDPRVRERLAQAPRPRAAFNYLGRLDRLVAAGPASFLELRDAALSVSPDVVRAHELEIGAQVIEGRLVVKWRYDGRRRDRERAAAAVRESVERLRDLVAFCLRVDVGALTPSDVPTLSLDQLALDRWMHAQPGLDPRLVVDVLPVTATQEGILFHALESRDPSLYVTQVSLLIDGDLDEAAFQAAWQRIVARHEALRTRVARAPSGAPVRVIVRAAEAPWTIEDWSHEEPVARESRLERFLASDRARGVAVDRAPGMRLHLARMGARTWRFTWTSHHVFLDGWSLAIVLRDVVRAYTGTVGALASLDGISRRYWEWMTARADESAAAFQGTAAEEAEAYWRAALRELEAPTDLLLPAPPADSHRPQSNTGASLPAHESERVLDTNTTQALRAMARRHHLTLHTLLQGAWAILLSRLAGRDDVVFGVTVAGRPPELAGIEDAVGLFIQTLPAIARVDEDAPLIAWLSGLQDEQAKREAYGHVSLSRIRSWTDVPGGTPLFDALFVFENYPVDSGLATRAGGFVLQDVRVAERTNYPLTGVVSDGERITIRIQADARRYTGDAARDLALRLARLLEAIVEMTESPPRIADLEWKSPGERERVRAWAEGPSRIYEGAETLVDLIEEQVARTPDAVAVTFESMSWTYRDLDRRANAVAARLRELGVDAGTRVAVIAERSLELELALWSVLKAGAAWVPLDPQEPPERLAFMLRDAGAAAVLTLERHRAACETAASSNGIPVETLDGARLASREADAPPSRTTGPDEIAYMIYTSGSTGEPKGALNTHRGIRNRLLWMQEEFALAPGETVLQKTPATFDVSVWEFFWPLIAGARLVLASPGLHRDPRGLAALIDQESVTTLHFVPSMLDVFLDLVPPGACCSLKRVICSGESLTADLRDRFFRRFSCQLSNLYGPTEAAVDVSFHHCFPGETGPVPIGRPIANVTLPLLDRRGRPVPVGVAGEVHIGGVAVGAGYLGRDALTAERFIPDRASSVPGARLYRTGDLGRWTPEGEIEYLGRMDHQVKIRGVRIELGEIEAALRRCPGVCEAAVVAEKQGAGGVALSAYFTPSSSDPATRERVHVHLASCLPEAMRPSRILALDRMPLLSSGKLDRKSLSRALDVADGAPPGNESSARAGESSARSAGGDLAHRERTGRNGDRRDGGRRDEERRDVEHRIAAIWAEVLGLASVDPRRNFFELGGNSLLMMRIHARLHDELGVTLPITDLFRHPTVAALARFLGGEPVSSPESTAGAETRPIDREAPIAVIGLACRFPGADSVEEFWENLLEGRESIRRFGPDELKAAGVPDAIAADPAYVPAHGALKRDPALFDADLFGYSPREASLIDPQQRIFLEICHELFERAGYEPGSIEAPVGVFAGASLNLYLLRNLASNPALVASAGSFPILIGNDKDFLPTRVAYKMNLRGPAVNVQSACSTSLVATVMACESLARGECDLAIAGGVSVRLPQVSGYLHEEGMIFSPDGHCRAFDAAGAGIVAGSGAGAVLLKRLDDALRDGDHVHAVIRGGAMNNDGAAKVGFTAPGVDGQAAVLRAALARAGVDAATIGYIEAHGTATPLGDPIEVAALNQVFASGAAAPDAATPAIDPSTAPSAADQGALAPGSHAPGSRLLGSVKTNLGHLDAAAGVAGLMKAVLAVEHGVIPPSLHFEKPNPAVPFSEGPFRVAAGREPWPLAGPRRAGVSSFGIGGTNAHVVLEAAPVSPKPGNKENDHAAHELLAISARTPDALDHLAAALASRLESPDAPALADVAATLGSGRKRHAHRRIAIGVSPRELASAIRAVDGLASFETEEPITDRPVVFFFSGQGAPYVGMTRGLYEAEPVYRRAIERARELVQDRIGWDLLDVIAPRPGREDEAARSLERQVVVHVALLAVETALAELWMSWGLEPEAVTGHSLGEYAAAVVAGVFTLDDAMTLVASRGQLLDELPPGGLLAIPLPSDDVVRRLEEAGYGHGTSGPTLSLAVINTPGLCLVSGALEPLAAFESELLADGVQARRARVNRAVHSSLVDPLVPRFLETVRSVRLNAPRLPILSHRTATWMTAEDAQSPEAWARHLREPVRFSDGLAHLVTASARGPWRHPPAFLEVGPGRTLASAILRHPAAEGLPVLTSVRHPDDAVPDHAFLLATLGRLWLAGARVDVTRGIGHRRQASAAHPDARPMFRRVPLPVAPLKSSRHWIEEPDAARAASMPALDPERWTWAATWTREAPTTGAAYPIPRRWLVIADASPMASSSPIPSEAIESLQNAISARGSEYTLVHWSHDFQRVHANSFYLDPANGDHWRRLAAALEEGPGRPDVIVHAGFAGRRLEAASAIADDLPATADVSAADEVSTKGCHALIGIAQAFGGDPRERPIRIVVLTSGLADISGNEPIDPALALLQGPLRVIPQEHRDLSCVALDLRPEEWATASAGEALLEEICRSSTAPVVAIRQGRRWVEDFVFQPMGPETAVSPDAATGPGGIYLVTGGTGGMGLELAEELAAGDPTVRLVLLSRHGIPDGGPARERLEALRESVAGLWIEAVDVADRNAVQALQVRIAKEWGPVAGIVHAAGVPGRGLIQARTKELWDDELAAKVRGTLWLDEFFGAEARFIVCCSSTNAVCGGLGQVGYAAANAFQDAWANQAPRSPKRARRIAILWHRWQGVGMGVLAENLHRTETGRELEPGIPRAAGRAIFRRLITPGTLRSVAVCPCDLPSLLRESRGSLADLDRGPASSQNASADASDRPGGSGTIASRTTANALTFSSELEQAIAGVWAAELGRTGIGATDSFAGLGGDSLLAVKVAGRLRRELGVNVTVRMLYDAPTVRLLASAIEAVKWASGALHDAPRSTSSKDGAADETETGLL